MDTCQCLRGSEGFSLDPETGMWVHAECRLPTAPELARHQLKELL